MSSSSRSTASAIDSSARAGLRGIAVDRSRAASAPAVGDPSNRSPGCGVLVLGSFACWFRSDRSTMTFAAGWSTDGSPGSRNRRDPR